jgi:DNA polymerase-1
MKRLFLIDLMSQFFRSHMALDRNPLTTGDGMVVSGIHGVLRAILRIQQVEEPDGIIVCTDTAQPTFRHELFSEYKGHRPPMPEAMSAQIPLLYDLLERTGLKPLALPGFEADDLLATLALRARDAGWEVFIVSSDKDLMQVVGENLYLYRTGNKGEVTLVGPEGVREKFKVGPAQVIDVLALMGDASDNVPGVPGIGEKTAATLIGTYGTLEGVYEHLEDLGTKAIRRYLEENREKAFLSRQLVTIDTRTPCDFDPAQAGLPQWQAPGVSDLLMRLGFRSMLEELARIRPAAASASPDGAPAPSHKRDYRLVADRQAFELFHKELDAATAPGPDQRTCAFDTETTGLDSLACELVGFSFCWIPGEAWFVPARFAQAGGMQQGLFAEPASPDLPWITERLRPWYEDAERPKCGQNCKYDINVLSQLGITVRGVVFDTMLASFVLKPSGRQHNLDSLALHYLGMHKIPTSELIGSGRKQITMAEVPLDKLSDYACEDADAVLQLVPLLRAELREAGLEELFSTIDMPVMELLCRVEQNGVRLDVDELARMSVELEQGIAALEHEIHAMAGEAFNLNSPSQLGRILFEKFKLKPGKKTQSGFSTDVTELERLAREEPLPRRILDYRQLAKLKSTYVDALPRMVNTRSGRIHTSFNQTIAATGRLSSTDPNLQNIPIRTELGKRLRGAFVPAGPDRVLIDADYSQIELRVLAHISEDAELVRSYREGEDIHCRTAAAIFGVSPDSVDEEQRRMAKVVNFGVIYGMGAFALAGNLEIPVKEAARFIEQYFTLYAGVKQWVERTLEETRRLGYVSNLFGRRRYLPEITSDNRVLRENTERIAMNTPIQGSAADLIKLAMIRLDNRIRTDLPELRMISQVHDELLFDAPRDRAAEYTAIVKHEMESAISLRVPLVAQAAWGDSWREAH